MTTSPTQPDLRRTVFKPGDRVTGTGAPWPRPGTVQPYPTDPVTIEVLFDGEAEPVTFYVEELDLLSLVEPAPAPEAVERACRQCGCTTENACQSAGPDGLETCFWSEVDLCSTCADDQTSTPAVEVAEPEAPARPDYASSAYLAALNLLYLTELLDGRHDVNLTISWDGSRGRETTLHLAAEAALEDAAALAARIGLGNYKAKPYKGDVQHRWTGERHGLRVEVVWIEHDAAPVETPAAGE